jgi:hypothetical protein
LAGAGGSLRLHFYNNFQQERSNILATFKLQKIQYYE